MFFWYARVSWFEPHTEDLVRLHVSNRRGHYIIVVNENPVIKYGLKIHVAQEGRTILQVHAVENEELTEVLVDRLTKEEPTAVTC